MELHARAGRGSPQPQVKEALSFQCLHQLVQGLVDHGIHPKAGRVEKWSFRAGMAAAGIGILTVFLPTEWLPRGA